MFTQTSRSTAATRDILVLVFVFLCGCSSTYGAVFQNSLGTGSPSAEPFSLEAGESLRSLFVNQASEVAINGGSITNTANGLSRSPLRLTDDAKATINEGLLRNVGPGGSPVIRLERRSDLVVNGGRLESLNSFEEVLFATNSLVSINGGSFFSTASDNIHTFFSADLEINGGDFLVEGPNSALRLRSDGSSVIRGGTFRSVQNSVGQSGRGVTLLSGSLDFIDGSIESVGTGIFTNGFPELNIHGGSIRGDSTGLRVLNGSVSIYGGEIDGGIDLVQLGGTVSFNVVAASLDGQVLGDGPISASSGILDLKYADNGIDSLTFTRSGGAINITLVVPEPSSLLLAITSISVRIFSRKKLPE